jgi:hypothetical protein
MSTPRSNNLRSRSKVLGFERQNCQHTKTFQQGFWLLRYTWQQVAIQHAGNAVVCRRSVERNTDLPRLQKSLDNHNDNFDNHLDVHDVNLHDVNLHDNDHDVNQHQKEMYKIKMPYNHR